MILRTGDGIKEDAMTGSKAKVPVWEPVLAAVVLIVFVAASWLYAYLTSPSALRIERELSSLPADSTVRQLVDDGFTDMTGQNAVCGDEVTAFLDAVKEKRTATFKYVTDDDGITATTLWYDPYESNPWARATEDGGVVIGYDHDGRVRAWRWRAGEIVQADARYGGEPTAVEQDDDSVAAVLPWRPQSPDRVPYDDPESAGLPLCTYRE